MNNRSSDSPQNQIIPIVLPRGNHPKAPVLECPQCDQIIIIANTGAVLIRINGTVPFRKDHSGRRASIRPPASVSVIVCHLVWQPTSMACASASTVRACGTVLASLSPNTNRSPASADMVEAQAPQVYHIR